MREVVIVGGGIVGLLSAFELTKREIPATVIDQSEGGLASWAGGGILSPLYAWRYSDAMNRLTFDAMARYRGLFSELVGRCLEWSDLHQGGLWVHVDTKEMNTVKDWAGKWGVLSETLSGSDLLPSFPFSEGVFFPDLGNVRNPRLLKALRSYLASRGVSFIRDKVVSLLPRQKGAALETQNGLVLNAENVIFCAGVGSSKLLSMLGVSLPMFPVKGEMLLYHLTPSRVPSVMLTQSGYLIPRADGAVLVGSTLIRGDCTTYPTVSGRYQLEAVAANLLPELASRTPAHHWAGVRPGSEVDYPYIGAVPGCNGVFAAAGHYRNGLVSAPATAELLVQMMCGERPNIDPAPYSLSPGLRSRSSFFNR
ncbi:NAD(P)/FAD-dependent oxidoreductase [Alcanivorax jadensis]|jgi:glycine oxidase|uniref:NAD(P)/FAD-dependent oxidoreductase n=1 Tax=Alcanivorax jadensis TaxID=64988 RepID=UPI002355F70C|nr:FAD-dependent oxidoreductase [Alcanivorax jadensis]|tara:strand:- start:204 stop:1301 length:1098 start_codon:yes stop_codon:yes gene_type:complete